MKRSELVDFLSIELDLKGVQDKSKNGLQVQGPEEVNKVVLAVDACMAVFEAAAEAGAELVVVHHGLFWGDIDGLKGVMYDRIRFLMENDIGVYCAHLPLDLHPTFGHNAILSDIIGLTDRKGFAKVKDRTIGFKGRLENPRSAQALAEDLQDRIGGTPIVLPGSREKVETVGVVSGGGGNDFWEALDDGLDCFITGETNYSIFHDASESGTAVIFTGHYESETVGMTALGNLLEEKFGLETLFADVPAPSYHGEWESCD